MMRKNPLTARAAAMGAVLAAAVALAGCGGGTESADKDGDGKITNEEVVAQSASNLPDPGLYKMSVEVEELTYPGMPASMVDEMKKQMSASFQTEQCITEADREEAVKQMTDVGSEGCEYSKYEMGGGKIDAAMSCPLPAGGTIAYTMQGTINSKGADILMEGGQQGGAAGTAMNMKMRMKSVRVGDCTA